MGPAISVRMASASCLRLGMYGPKSLGPERRQKFLNNAPAAILERLLESADDFVAKRVVGADRSNLLVTLIASPLPEGMARLRARPAGPDQVGKLAGIALRQVVRCRDRDDVDGLAR